MTYVDIDGDPGTFSSSSATVTLPPGATVKYAVLTWGAVTVAGSGGSAPRNLASRDVVKLKVPGSSDYETVQAGLLDSINAIYQGVADVTDAVRQAGTGTYTVADVQAGTGNDRYAAWSLTVLYEDRTQPRRHLSILTGFQNSASNLGRVTVPVSEVVTPDQGPFVTRVGVMAYEGTGVSRTASPSMRPHWGTRAIRPLTP